MRYLFIVSGRMTPSTRFRIEPFIRRLRAAGDRCDVAYSFPEKYSEFKAIGWRASQYLKLNVRRFHALLAKVRHYDAIVIEREVFDNDSSEIEQKLRRATGRLILDVDDGVFLRHPEKFDTIARLADVAIAGNAELEAYLASRCPRVVRIPTCVEMDAYSGKLDTDHERPVVGWMGTTHNVPFLAVAASALREVACSIPFRLLVVSADDCRLGEVDLDGVDVEFRRWSASTEVADLQAMDIGLMPLPDDQPWMKYKCGLKLLQYMAVGVPGIASPIGINTEILDGGCGGRLATDHASWVNALHELLGDAELRRRLGHFGRQRVIDHYSVERYFPMVRDVLRGVATTS